MMRSLCVSIVGALLVMFGSPIPAAAYEAVTVTDGGTITGKVTFQGAAPTKKIIPDKDPTVCGGLREDPLVVLGPGQGVAEAIVYLKGVEKGKAMTPKPAKPPEIVNHNCRFEPHVQALPVGSLVIVNSDPIMHNTHGFLEKATVFNQALPVKGMHVPKPLNKPGLVQVKCDVHGWMLGWVYVADNPYYAVTKKDGTFSLTDVLPGSYTLVAWQEYTGPTEVQVTVPPKGSVPVTIELKK
jgi:polysaccharide lyase family 4-like protein